jgi:hypothetical protein
MVQSLFHSLIIFRPANAYSLQFLNDQPRGFVERCLWAIEHDKTLNFVAHPKSQRQYGSHSDFVDVMMSFLWQVTMDSGHRIVNIAPPFTYNLSDIITAFEDYFKKRIKVEPFESDSLSRDSVILKSQVLYPDFVWNSIEQNLDLSGR